MITLESNLTYGEEVVDSISGLKGKVVAITKWQHGCVRAALQSPVDKDGKMPDAVWIDEPQLISVEGLDETQTTIEKGPGGPRKDPVRRAESKH